jgi:hypothetical protein
MVARVGFDLAELCDTHVNAIVPFTVTLSLYDGVMRISAHGKSGIIFDVSSQTQHTHARYHCFAHMW